MVLHDQVLEERLPSILGIDELRPKVLIELAELPIFSPTSKQLHSDFNWNYLSIRDSGLQSVSVILLPNKSGRPNIYDLNFMMFLTAQLLFAKDHGRAIDGWARFHPNKYFEFSKQGRESARYGRLEKTLSRLVGTLIRTNVYSEEFEALQEFHIIDAWRAVRNKKTGRMLCCEVKISDWLSSQIMNERVITLSTQYFEISSPFEKRLYLIFSKHVGQSAVWKITLEKLHQKHGRQGEFKRFKRELNSLNGLILGYRFEVNKNGIVEVRKRQ